MTGIPNSTLIALWVVGSCWAVSLIGYLFDEPADLVFPLGHLRCADARRRVGHEKQGTLISKSPGISRSLWISKSL